MSDKTVDWNAEPTGHCDEEGVWVEPDKEEDLVRLAMTRKYEEDKSMNNFEGYKTIFLDINKELDYLFMNYGQLPLKTLSSLIDTLSERIAYDKEILSTDMEEVTQVEPVEWIKDIQFIKEQMHYIAQVLSKEVKEVELDLDALDTYAYKAKILPNNEIEMVKIGKIDSFGKLELFAVETYPPIVPNFYQPEFYYIGSGSTSTNAPSNNSWNRLVHTVTPSYKKFVHKNVINQIVISKEDIKYSTGYINADGIAIYYDQLPKNITDVVKKND